MRYAIIADIHANLAAFTAVLDNIEHEGGVDEIWCLGDIVGYSPDPHQCIELLRQHQHVCVAVAYTIDPNVRLLVWGMI